LRDQPIAEDAGFHHRHEPFATTEPFPRELRKELLDLFRSRRALPSLDDITGEIPERNGELRA
jgi:hypothetical protein